MDGVFRGEIDVLKEERPDVLHSCHWAVQESTAAACQFAAEHSARVRLGTVRRNM
jgi:hypothetical protein